MASSSFRWEKDISNTSKVRVRKEIDELRAKNSIKSNIEKLNQHFSHEKRAATSFITKKTVPLPSRSRRAAIPKFLKRGKKTVRAKFHPTNQCSAIANQENCSNSNQQSMSSPSKIIQRQDENLLKKVEKQNRKETKKSPMLKVIMKKSPTKTSSLRNNELNVKANKSPLINKTPKVENIHQATRAITQALEASTSRPVNSSGVVIAPDGSRLYGFDAELHKKIEAKRDVFFEKSLADWIEAVLGQGTLVVKEDLWASLKNGVVLCNLLNAIKPGAVSKFHVTKLVPLKEMENIQLYLKACSALGISSSSLFATSDLFKAKSMPSVLANIYAVNLLAPSLGFKGACIDDEISLAAKKDFKKVKLWDNVETAPKKVQADVLALSSEGFERKQRQLELQVAELKAQMRQKNAQLGSLKQELDYIRSQAGESTDNTEASKRTDALQESQSSLHTERKRREQAEYELGLLRQRVDQKRAGVAARADKVQGGSASSSLERDFERMRGQNREFQREVRNLKSRLKKQQQQVLEKQAPATASAGTNTAIAPATASAGTNTAIAPATASAGTNTAIALATAATQTKAPTPRLGISMQEPVNIQPVVKLNTNVETVKAGQACSSSTTCISDSSGSGETIPFAAQNSQLDEAKPDTTSKGTDHQALEEEVVDQEVGRLLVAADIAEGGGSRAVAEGAATRTTSHYGVFVISVIACLLCAVLWNPINYEEPMLGWHGAGRLLRQWARVGADACGWMVASFEGC